MRLSVKDNGTGIPPAIQAHIFEPFFTTKAQGKGTGLGLPTVYGIVKQWRGHVEFDSQLGLGTEFRVWLPAQSGPADSLFESERPRCPPPGRETVLLAEDKPQVRRLIHTVLEQAGYTVLVAEDGQHALRVAQQAMNIDLLVSDVRTPHLGGVELARRLRQTWPGLRVLLMSGYPDIDAVNARENGVGDALFTKPFGTNELLSRVRSALIALSLVEVPSRPEPNARVNLSRHRLIRRRGARARLLHTSQPRRFRRRVRAPRSRAPAATASRGCCTSRTRRRGMTTRPSAKPLEPELGALFQQVIGTLVRLCEPRR